MSIYLVHGWAACVAVVAFLSDKRQVVAKLCVFIGSACRGASTCHQGCLTLYIRDICPCLPEFQTTSFVVVVVVVYVVVVVVVVVVIVFVFVIVVVVVIVVKGAFLKVSAGNGT